MADAYTRLTEPLEVSSPPETKRESAWWLILVAIGWLILANIPAFFFGFITAVSVRAMGRTMATTPNALVLIELLGVLGVGGIFLLASYLRGRIIGRGDIRIGLSITPVFNWPLVIFLCAFTALYALFLAFAGFKVRPEILAQRLSRDLWLEALTLVAVCFLAPVAEELFFRGWLWNGLKEHWNLPLTASVISAIWLAIHLERGVFIAAALVPVAVLIALARYFGRSVKASIAVHMTLNVAGFMSPWIFRSLA